MQTVSARSVVRRMLGERGARFVRECLVSRVPSVQSYQKLLVGRRALEIGGPSEIFSSEGPLPIYRTLEAVDNCLFASRTIWGGCASGRQFQCPSLKKPGVQFILEATDLCEIDDCTYECVLSSHCLEHIANPLRALFEWKRVLVSGGMLLLVLPHKDATFDRYRPTTTLAHLIDDYAAGVGEDDLTHLSEVLRLHDLTRDPRLRSAEEFRNRCEQNVEHRAMHHHVFDTPAVVEMLDYIGLRLFRVDNHEPCHIIALAEKVTGKPDNASFCSPNAPYRVRSCFVNDRPRVRQLI